MKESEKNVYREWEHEEEEQNFNYREGQIDDAMTNEFLLAAADDEVIARSTWSTTSFAYSQLLTDSFSRPLLSSHPTGLYGQRPTVHDIKHLLATGSTNVWTCNSAPEAAVLQHGWSAG